MRTYCLTNVTAAKILVFGKTGQVGWELRRALLPFANVTFLGKDECSLDEPANLLSVLESISPQVIINAAAYTAVDDAEEFADLALKINAEAPATMASWAKRNDAIFLHYSTDYVFDGKKREAYTESDFAAPLGAYGRSKAEGDARISEVGGCYFIFRTSWVYGIRGKNFLKTIINLAKEREELRVVNDQLGSPSWSRFLAEATVFAMHSLLRDGFNTASKKAGIYNLANSGSTSWHQFAKLIVEEASNFETLRCKAIFPIATEEYPTRAVRPKNSCLDLNKLEHNFGIIAPVWQHCLKLALQDYYRC